MRWLISMTDTPCAFRRRIRSSTSATWRTEIAAVGSSISTSLALREPGARDRHRLALAARHLLHEIARPGLRLQLLRTARPERSIIAFLSRTRNGQKPFLISRPRNTFCARGQIVGQRQVLVDDLDALRPRASTRFVEVTALRLRPRSRHRSGRKVAGDDLDHRRLAGAVVAHQADDLARLDGEADVRQRMDGAEMHGDVANIQQRHSRSSLPARGSDGHFTGTQFFIAPGLYPQGLSGQARRNSMTLSPAKEARTAPFRASAKGGTQR